MTKPNNIWGNEFQV
ncbi:rCG53307, partial [Rattus norvegicus]